MTSAPPRHPQARAVFRGRFFIVIEDTAITEAAAPQLLHTAHRSSPTSLSGAPRPHVSRRRAALLPPSCVLQRYMRGPRTTRSHTRLRQNWSQRRSAYPLPLALRHYLRRRLHTPCHALSVRGGTRPLPGVLRDHPRQNVSRLGLDGSPRLAPSRMYPLPRAAPSHATYTDVPRAQASSLIRFPVHRRQPCAPRSRALRRCMPEPVRSTYCSTPPANVPSAPILSSEQPPVLPPAPRTRHTLLRAPPTCFSVFRESFFAGDAEDPRFCLPLAQQRPCAFFSRGHCAIVFSAAIFCARDDGRPFPLPSFCGAGRMLRVCRGGAGGTVCLSRGILNTPPIPPPVPTPPPTVSPAARPTSCAGQWVLVRASVVVHAGGEVENTPAPLLTFMLSFVSALFSCACPYSRGPHDTSMYTAVANGPRLDLRLYYVCMQVIRIVVMQPSLSLPA
ncbi:hypothetical protein C8J57DRAFT_1592102 [Mycena rebaudengoi]|nr:hypothetical protein C8J57DRAFT_1592102 [Mycena rebaudengoi]